MRLSKGDLIFRSSNCCQSCVADPLIDIEIEVWVVLIYHITIKGCSKVDLQFFSITLTSCHFCIIIGKKSAYLVQSYQEVLRIFYITL